MFLKVPERFQRKKISSCLLFVCLYLLRFWKTNIIWNTKYVVKHKSAKLYMTYAVRKLEAALHIQLKQIFSPSATLFDPLVRTSTKLPRHKRLRIDMFRMSGTFRKGSKTAIYRHHFLFQGSLFKIFLYSLYNMV